MWCVKGEKDKLDDYNHVVGHMSLEVGHEVWAGDVNGGVVGMKTVA